MLNLVLYEIYCKQKYLKWLTFVVLILKKYQVFYLCPQVVPLAPDRPDTLIKGLLSYSATPLPVSFFSFSCFTSQMPFQAVQLAEFLHYYTAAIAILIHFSKPLLVEMKRPGIYSQTTSSLSEDALRKKSVGRSVGGSLGCSASRSSIGQLHHQKKPAVTEEIYPQN